MSPPLRLCAFILIVVGCAGPQETPEPETPTQPTCEATFRWLQKDAYAARAGRTSEAWPPHTTTQLQVRCDDGFESSAQQTNHGTPVDAKTDDGDSILVEMHRETKTGTREELEALLTRFQGCECSPVTEFLGLEMIEDGQVQERLMEAVADYAQNRLSCEAPVTPAEIVEHLRAERIEQALAGLETCSWGEETSWEEAFQTAFGEVVDDAAKYHVCNNDVMIQTVLWNGFDSGQPMSECGDREAFCHGPRWYYTPP